MSDNVPWLDQQRMEIAAKALTKHGFDAIVVATKDEAREKILELIPAGASVGSAGSLSVRQLGIMPVLEQRGNACHYQWRGYTDRDEELAVRHKAVNSDFFLVSSNAVTMEGELVNTDGTGNRVSGMIFGPSHTIIVAGANKVVGNVAEGLARIKSVAAPDNAHRLKLKLPCAETGVCINCDSPVRICRVTTIMERRPFRTKMTVILVGEPLGS